MSKDADGNPVSCRNCERAILLYRRGLCYRCYADREIRVKYPLLNCPRNNRGVPNVPRRKSKRPAPPVTPCPHVPGSEGKILVMIARARRGDRLFHPLDATADLG